MQSHARGWNFASVVPLPDAADWAHAGCLSGADSLRGSFRPGGFQPGERCYLGFVYFAETESSKSDLEGCVACDGTLTLWVGPIELRSREGQCNELVEKRGGYLDLAGTDRDTGARHAWRLYLVIAADKEDVEKSDWTSPQQQFLALLMGTHPRLGAGSPVARLEDSILRLIHSFVKMAPIWSDLEQEVDFEQIVEQRWPEFSPAELVHQYRAFLALKVDLQDWTSDLLSPPMIEYKGERLVDEVWHLHLSMACYEEDSMLLTGGHIIEHQPVLSREARERYVYTYDLHCERCQENDEEVDARCWPNPYEDDEVSDGYPSDYPWDGCC